MLQILEDIEQSYDLQFSYATESIEGKKVTIDAKNQSLEGFLKALYGLIKAL